MAWADGLGADKPLLSPGNEYPVDRQGSSGLVRLHEHLGPVAPGAAARMALSSKGRRCTPAAGRPVSMICTTKCRHQQCAASRAHVVEMAADQGHGRWPEQVPAGNAELRAIGGHLRKERDHLFGVVQQDGVRIRGLRSKLLRPHRRLWRGGAVPGVRAFEPKWRTRQDSNLWPSPSEGTGQAPISASAPLRTDTFSEACDFLSDQRVTNIHATEAPRKQRWAALPG